MTENLIINGVDHAKFDLEWAKRGGVIYHADDEWQILKFVNFENEIKQNLFWSVTHKTLVLLENGLRMATPAECKAAGIEYIEPPIRWLQIDSAPEDGRIIEVADFRVVVANECPLSKHWKFWRDIPHPLNKNSMTQPPKGE